MFAFGGYKYFINDSDSDSESDSDDNITFWEKSNESMFSPLYKTLLGHGYGGEADVEMLIEKDIELETVSDDSEDSEESEESEESEDSEDKEDEEYYEADIDFVEEESIGDEDTDTYYSSDFDSESSSDEEDNDEDNEEDEDNGGTESLLEGMVVRYYKLNKFDIFCREYYAASAIARVGRVFVMKSKKAKHRALLELLLKKEEERMIAVKEANEYKRRQHENNDIMKRLIDSSEQKSREEKERENERTRVAKKRAERERKEQNILKINLERRKMEIREFLKEEERLMVIEMNRMNEEKERLEKDRLEKERFVKELKEREDAIMLEQERKFFEKRRKQVLEKIVADKLVKISDIESEEHNRQMRIKLKAISDGWKEKRTLNAMWRDIRTEIILNYHKKQFSPVLENLLRSGAYRESGEKWVMVADELKKRRVDDEGIVGERGDGKCVIC